MVLMTSLRSTSRLRISRYRGDVVGSLFELFLICLYSLFVILCLCSLSFFLFIYSFSCSFHLLSFLSPVSIFCLFFLFSFVYLFFSFLVSFLPFSLCFNFPSPASFLFHFPFVNILITRIYALINMSRHETR